MEKGIKVRTSRRNSATSISPEARKLILATVRRYKSQRKAARVLRLKSHIHLVRMLKGEMRETPAMKAAVIRAKARASRAFLMEREDVPLVERERIARLVRDAKAIIEILEGCL
jgi:hypothetical protein